MGLNRQDVVDGCSTITIMLPAWTMFWSVMFYLVYNVVLPIWINDLVAVNIYKNIFIGFILGVFSVKFGLCRKCFINKK